MNPATLSLSEAATMFRRAVSGRNIMTPNWLDFFPLFDGCAELSTGRGIEGEKIYGVTVVRQNKHHVDEGECFFSRREAEECINPKLKGGV